MAVQPNKTAFVTGISGGIGKAIAERLLNEGYHVFGISRNNAIKHDNYCFIPLDLSNPEAVHSFVFPNQLKGSMLLINNAGIIGKIGRIGETDQNSIQEVIQVNVIAPEILMNKFLKSYSGSAKSLHILNISSGAGKYPIESWATYCSSKAALDLFSLTVAEEFKRLNRNQFHIHSVAPGVVDTGMQEEIRSSAKSDFPLVDKFISYKESDELYSPDHVADKLMELISAPQRYPEVLQSVRDL